MTIPANPTKARSTAPAIVLAGLESAGKSAVFRGLSGQATGDEANFRGSTVVCRRCHLPECDCDLVDTPGIRTREDSATTRLALGAAGAADIVLLVVRGTHAQAEVETLLTLLDGTLRDRRSVLAITFEDKSPAALADLARHYRETLGVPVVTLDARSLSASRRIELLAALRLARPLAQNPASLARPIPLPAVDPAATPFEHPLLGPPLALLTMALLFAVPVFLAYLLAAAAQPLLDAALLDPLKGRLAHGLPPFASALLGGSYELFTLGAYSFLWAFPVVVFIGLSVALAEETGLKDRITAALDPLLRRAGLSGRDLVPILSGFGCNVVAVFQSRACGSCTRRACVSMIAFGSACSYQIGASLSLFGSGGRVRAGVRQFLFQAMPIFPGICLAAGVLDQLGALAWAARGLAPAAGWFNLPGEAMPGILFSAVRKDGLLLLQQDEGGLVRGLGAGQLFVLVYLAAQRRRLRDILGKLNPGAELVEARRGEVPLARVLDTGRFDLDKAMASPGWLRELNNVHTPETEEYGIGSFVFRARRPFHPERIWKFMNADWPGRLRSKGHFWLASRHDVIGLWSQAGSNAESRPVARWWASMPVDQWPEDEELREGFYEDWQDPYGDRRQELVYIGQNLEKDRMLAALGDCLLTDQEMARKPAGWKKLVDPFPEWVPTRPSEHVHA